MYCRVYSLVVVLLGLVICQGAASVVQGQQAPEPESGWCVEKRGICVAGCHVFGEELDKVSFECSDSGRSMVQASTCVCLGAQDRVLSSSSDSSAKGFGASAASSSFASSSSSSNADFVL